MDRWIQAQVGTDRAPRTAPAALPPVTGGQRQLLVWVVAPGLLVLLVLALYRLWLSPSWVGDGYDDGQYFEMSRNVWKYGAPVLDTHGTPAWSRAWSPFFPMLVSPLGALPIGPSAIAERLVEVALSALLLVLAGTWLAREAGLSRSWVTVCLVCLGSAPIVILMSSGIMSDMPAAVAVLGGIVLLRRQRFALGTACLLLAYMTRAIDLMVVAAALGWLLLQRRWGHALRSAALAGAGIGGWSLVQAINGGGSEYIRELMSEGPRGGPPGLTDVARVAADNLGQIVNGQLGALLVGMFHSRVLVQRFGYLAIPLTLAMMALAAEGWRRRRLGLEAVVCLATLAAVLLWPWPPYRFLLPLAPLLLGGMAITLADLPIPRRSLWASGLAALVVASNLQNYVAVTPSRAASQARVKEFMGAYTWVRKNIPADDQVVAFNDVQCRLYSGHTASRSLPFIPHHTYFVVDRTLPGTDPSQHPLDFYRGEIVYDTATAFVFRADAMR